MPPRAVLFDFDGVIADTENVHVAAWERTFALMGRDVPPVVCARSAEEDDGRFLASVLEEAGIEDGDVDGWVKRKQAITLGMLAAWPRLYPGVVELTGALRDRAALGVVTGTWRENVEAILRSSALRDSFRLIVAKEDVRKPKPDPSLYRKALAKLGLEPGEAVALEDSPSGIASAQKAGIRVLAIGHRRPPGDWCSGAAYLPSLADAKAVLRAIESAGSPRRSAKRDRESP